MDFGSGLIGILESELQEEAMIDYDQDGVSPRFGRQLMPGLELAIINYLREAKNLADFSKKEAHIHPLVAHFEKSDETKLAVVLAAYAHVLAGNSACAEIDLKEVNFEYWRSIGLEYYDSDISNWPWM